MSRFDHLEMNSAPAPFPDNDPPGTDFHDFMERAEKSFSEGNWERALTLYSRSLQFDTELEEAWVGQIRCLIELKEIEEAIIWCGRALEHFPNSPLVLAAHAVASLRLKDVDGAGKFIDAAMTAREVTPYVWICRGEVLLAKRSTNSKACFLKAIEMSPSADTYAALARACMAHAEMHQAVGFFRKAVNADPDRFICWYWMGLCQEQLGDFDEAAASFRRCASANPTFAPARESFNRLSDQGVFSKIGKKTLGLFHR